MAKDYKREASRTSPQRPQGSWLSFLTGLAIGLAVAACVWLWFQRPEVGTPLPVATAPTAAPITPAPQPREPPPPPVEPVTKPTFDFYTILPEIEVRIPEGETPPPPPAESAAAAESTAAPITAASANYVLQVASFQQPAEADQSKALLALQGVPATIHKVGVNGQYWFRVHVGPYSELAEAQQMRGRLDQLGFRAIVLKTGGG